MDRLTQIGLVGLSDAGIDGRIRRGLVQYARPDRPWQFIDAKHDRSLMHLITSDRIDAVVAHVTDAAITRKLSQLGRPVIDVSGQYGKHDFLTVTCDNELAGALAAKTFALRELRYAGFIADRVRLASDVERCRGFASALSDHDMVFHDYQRPVFRGRTTVASRSKALIAHLSQWLIDLPKPIGILTGHDRIGIDLINLCRSLDLAIPDELAVLAIGDIDLMCETCYPPLAAVNLPAERIGYRVGEIITDLLAGRPHPDRPILIPPSHVTMRLSADVFAVDDPIVRAALRFITDHAHRRIAVSDVVDGLTVTRRDLERRFARHLGRTPFAEIQRAQIERAKTALTTGDRPMPDVARYAGFRDGNHLAIVFRRITGQSPSAYRKSHRTDPRLGSTPG